MGEPEGSYYAADFTSTVKDTCDACGGKALLKYMRHKNPMKVGRHLCPICYDRYLNKEGTVHRSSSGSMRHSVTVTERQVIHQQIARAQRGNISNSVQAVGVKPGVSVGHLATGHIANTSSGPIHMPGPVVHLPGHAPDSGGFQTLFQQGKRPMSYRAEHAAYPNIRNDRIQEAYATHNGEIVVVEARLVVRQPGKLRPDLVHDILEAVDHIPVHIGAEKLKKILYDAVIPRWNSWTKHYPLPLDSVMMRDHNWVHLLPQKPDRDIIAKQFFKPGKKGAMVFKSGKCVVNLHIPNEIYQSMLMQKEEQEETVEIAAVDFTLAKTKGKKRMRSPSPMLQPSPTDSPIELLTMSRSVSDTPQTFKRAKVTSSETNRDKLDMVVKSRHASQAVTPVRTSGSASADSMDGTPYYAEEMPSQVASASHNDLQTSPTAQQISQALKAQRCPTNKEIRLFFELSVFNVLAYPVEHWEWKDLVEQHGKPASSSAVQEPGKNFYLGKPLSTMLQLDLSSSKIKKGGFKLAAFGTSTTCLFKSTDATEICAKRTYIVVERVISDSRSNGSLVTKSIDVPHDSRKQFQNLSMEIACAVWARALLNLVYDFIDKERKRVGRIPFNIPRFRFVELALAMEHDSAAVGGRQNLNSVFLIEEVITEDQQGPFRKYLNNVSPTPLIMSSEEDNERAKFLSFSQHVQYLKTMKQAFVSDYQGGNSLLTDPQISSSRSLGPIFADGNVPSIHRDFEKKHCCNYFCKWFSLPTDYDSEEYNANI